MKKTLAAILVIGLFEIGFGTILFWRNSASSTTGKPATLVLGDGGSSLSVLIYICNEMGFFKKHGLDVRYTPYPSGKMALQSLLNGAIDLATVADTPLAEAMVDGEDFRIIATIGNSRESIGIAANASIRQPSDLIGKKVGYVQGTNADFFLTWFLTKYQIPLEAITKVGIPPMSP